MSNTVEHRYSDFPQELLCTPGPALWEAKTAWLPMSDGALIWYSDTGGNGPPLVLAHGWTASSAVWRKNAPELAKRFRVITLDWRGHGSSSKVLHGHTLSRYALDLAELVTYLGLDRPALVGWSLAGAVLMEFWRQCGHLAPVRALALVDSSIGPFADGEWNAFRMKKGKMDDMNAVFRTMRADYEGFIRNFIPGMFANPPSDADVTFLSTEMAKTPPWIAAAIHSDFAVHNYEPLLPGVTTPTAVFSGLFISEKNLEMGKYFAERLPQGRYYPHPKASHILFYEEPELFNARLMDFLEGVLAAEVK